MPNIPSPRAVEATKKLREERPANPYYWQYHNQDAEIIQSAITAAVAEAMRIYTRCPACGNDTLTINDDKHLLCTWIECPDPCAIEKLSEAMRELTAERDEAKRLASALQNDIARLGKCTLRSGELPEDAERRINRTEAERDALREATQEREAQKGEGK